MQLMAISIGDPNAASMYASLEQIGTETPQMAVGSHAYEIPVADNLYEYEVFFMLMFARVSNDSCEI